jgi:hypothetical protein
MKKIKLYQLIILLAVPILIAGCTKKQKKPFGENMMSMQMNGQDYYAKGTSNSFQLLGIKQSLTGDIRRIAGIFDSKVHLNVNGLPLINIMGTYSLEALDTVVTKTLYLGRRNGANKLIYYVNRANSGTVSINANNQGFIAGTFNATLYQDTTWLTSYDPSSPDSLIITNGYFDVPVR